MSLVLRIQDADDNDATPKGRHAMTYRNARRALHIHGPAILVSLIAAAALATCAAVIAAALL